MKDSFGKKLEEFEKYLVAKPGMVQAVLAAEAIEILEIVRSFEALHDLRILNDKDLEKIYAKGCKELEKLMSEERKVLFVQEPGMA